MQRIFFLGIEKTPLLEKKLQQASPYDRSLFFSPDFLTECISSNVTYIGKSVDGCLTYEALELVSDHVQSILSRIVKDYPISKSNLRLVPIISHE